MGPRSTGGGNGVDKGGGGYRDRAEERRKGVNPDYEDAIARLVDMDAEKTKYLGGDVKHTHLVKGLDYALLQKVKGVCVLGVTVWMWMCLDGCSITSAPRDSYHSAFAPSM